MSLSTWFMGFGLVGSIAKEVIKMYVIINRGSAPEKEKLDAVFGMWSHKHIDFPKLSRDVRKSLRVEDVWEDIEKGGPKSLLDVFLYALSIEADVSLKDRTLFRKSIKVFETIASKYGLDVSDSCVHWYRTLNIMDGKDPFENIE